MTLQALTSSWKTIKPLACFIGILWGFFGMVFFYSHIHLNGTSLTVDDQLTCFHQHFGSDQNLLYWLTVIHVSNMWIYCFVLSADIDTSMFWNVISLPLSNGTEQMIMYVVDFKYENVMTPLPPLPPPHHPPPPPPPFPPPPPPRTKVKTVVKD